MTGVRIGAFSRVTILVRSAALLGYDTLAIGLGLEPALLLSRFDLPQRALHDPNLLISYQAVIDLLEHTAAIGRCPDLGLRLARVQGLGVLGPIAVLLRHAGNLGEAFTLASRYLFVHSPALRLERRAVAGRADLVDVVLDISHARLATRPQIASLSVGIICHGVQALTGDKVRPRLVTLPHAPVADAAIYRQAYGCTVQFMAEVPAVRLATSDLGAVIPANDPQVRDLALGYLERLASPPQTLLSDRVRDLLRGLLGAAPVGQSQIAEALSMHPRTLQRRLGAEGATFEQLLDSVRHEKFLELINLPQGPGLTQIAHVLGYAEPSVLTRSCKRWFGVTPSAMRLRRHSQGRGLGAGSEGVVPDLPDLR